MGLSHSCRLPGSAPLGPSLGSGMSESPSPHTLTCCSGLRWAVVWGRACH